MSATREPVAHSCRMAPNQQPTTTSTRTTGNDPSDGPDPGGTHSTKPGQRDKSAPKSAEPVIHNTVASGDRNAENESEGPPLKRP